MTHLRFRDVLSIVFPYFVGGVFVVLAMVVFAVIAIGSITRTSCSSPGLVRIQDVQRHVTCYRIEGYEGIACLHDEPNDGGMSQ